MENRILKIDLSNRSHKIEEIPDKIIKQYIGGRGLGSYLLYTLVAPGVDPLGEENHLIFTGGPANGTTMPYSSKAVMHTKSPLTGLFLYGVCSGFLGHHIRKAGFWAIDIAGSADSPVYLKIDNQKVEFKDASHLVGMETAETQKLMLSGLPMQKAATVAIGPAGEKLIRYASIMADGHMYRAFGRGGAGCVMGAKRLKGIMIAGDETVGITNKYHFEKLRKSTIEKVKQQKEWATSWQRYGTRGSIAKLNKLGILPTRNWQGGVFEGVDNICFITTERQWPWQTRSCGPYCPTPCSDYIEIDKGSYKGAHCDGPEFETLYSFGSNCGIDRLDAIVAADQICDEYGIDTMSAGLSLGFAMECFENNLIGLNDTDGIELRFGDDKAMIEMLKKIVAQEGFGKFLAEGVRSLSKKIKGSESFAMHVKGLELGGYECRGLNGQALQFAINNRGGDHHGYGLPARVEAFDGTGQQVEGKGEMVKNMAIGQIISDSIPNCTFGGPVISPPNEAVSSFFREAWSINDIREVGMRIMCQERLFNMREGVSRKDDTLPPRLLLEPKPDGPMKGAVVPLETLKDDFYRAMGWDVSTGNPTDAVLDGLGIKRQI